MALGSEDPRRLQWNPDHTSFIDQSQFPNAIWQDTDYGGGSEGAPGMIAGWYTPGGYRPNDTENTYDAPQLLDAGRRNYWDLKDAGLWNLQDPNSDAWQYLQGQSKQYGDPQTDASALYYALAYGADLGQAATGRDAENRKQVEDVYHEALQGLNPEFVDLFSNAVGDSTEGYWTASKQHEGQGAWKDIDDTGKTFVDFFTKTPLGAALMAYLGPAMAAGMGGGTAGTLGAGAAMGGANAALQGGDIFKGAAMGGLQAYGGSQIPGGDVVAGADVPAGGADFSGAVPASSTPGFTSFDAQGVPMSSTPAMTNFSAGEGTLPVLSGQTGSFATPGMLNGFNSPVSDSDLNKLDAQNRDALEAGDNPPPAPAEKTFSIDPRTAAKVLSALIGMTGKQSADGGGDTPSDAPQRQEGQTDADYSQNLAQYMSLDADTMAQQGLVPGTQEYYDYIMQQADEVIRNIAGDVDVNADDLTAQFRGKSEQELEQLQRALYVRGQLGTLAGSGQHTDPFTGASQNVVSPDGMLFNPSVGAFQRGKAADVENLRGLRGQEGFDQLQQLLGRKSDLFGMDRAAQERFEQAKLEDDLRRRRGMLSY